MFLPTALHILGSIKHVGEGISHVEGITQTMKAELTEGFKKMHGRHVFFWFE